MTRVAHLVIGPEDHGVVIFAQRLAERTGGSLHRLPDPENLDPAALSGCTRAHLNYTDALFGPDTASASSAFCRLRAALPVPVSVTLHDLPDPEDEPARYARRSAGYLAVAHAADRAFVSSQHERRLLKRLGAEADVIPLPMKANPVISSDARPEPFLEVAVFGFLYPGKGHAELLQDMKGLPPQVRLTAIGRTADHHPGLAQDLAEHSDRDVRVTGFVPEHQLARRLRQAAVPVVPATRISASGSLNTWIEAGRRPLAAEGTYTRELAQAWDGALTLYPPGGFEAAARAALADPALTWLEGPPPQQLHEDSVAAAYRSALR